MNIKSIAIDNIRGFEHWALGISYSETYNLLGIIYNHPLHISGETDISQPLGMKFDNPAIRNMIKRLWED